MSVERLDMDEYSVIGEAESTTSKLTILVGKYEFRKILKFDSTSVRFDQNSDKFLDLINED